MPALDRAGIEAVLPHRDPFLFLDEVVELEPGVRGHARWTVEPGAWFLRGHFPGNPIVPGVVMVEAAAQAAATVALTAPANAGRFGVFGGIDGVRFSRIVRPGDVLDLRVEVERLRGPLGKVRAEVAVGAERAVRGLLTFALLEEAPR